MNDELRRVMREFEAARKQIEQIVPEEERKALESFCAIVQREITQYHLEAMVESHSRQLAMYTNGFVRRLVKKIGETQERIAQQAADVRIGAFSKSHHSASA